MNYYYGVNELNPEFIHELDDKYKNLEPFKYKIDFKIHNLILIIKKLEDPAILHTRIRYIKPINLFIVIDSATDALNSALALQIIDLFSDRNYKHFKHNEETNWSIIASKINKITKSEHMLDQKTKVALSFVSIALSVVCVILLIITFSAISHALSFNVLVNQTLEAVNAIKDMQTQLTAIESKMNFMDLALLLTGNH